MPGNPPRPVRPDDDTLRLASEIIGDVFESPALGPGSALKIKIDLTPGSAAVTISEPERRAIRDLVGLVRKFDMPSDDVRLDRLLEIIDRRGVEPDWTDGFEAAKKAHVTRNDVREIKVQEPDEPPSDDPTWIRPREAFDLWAYGELVHNDYTKELRWQGLGPLRQGLVRQMAHDYLMLLLAQAEFMGRLIAHGLKVPEAAQSEGQVSRSP